MTPDEAQELEHGLYELHWKSGGKSLAAVGSDQYGERWMAPTNWVSVSHKNAQWSWVLYAIKIDVED